MGTNQYERMFVAEPYPQFGGLPLVEVYISFGCEGVNLSGQIDSGIGCTGEPSIKFDPTDNPSTYDTEDDSFFELTFTENSGGGCGVSPLQTTISFTKVE